MDSKSQGAGAQLFHRAHLQHKALAVDVWAEAAAPRGHLLRRGGEGRKADPDKHSTAPSTGPRKPQDVYHQGATGRGEEQGEMQERSWLGGDGEGVRAILWYAGLPLLGGSGDSASSQLTALVVKKTFSAHGAASTHCTTGLGYQAQLCEGGQRGSAMTCTFGWAGNSWGAETPHRKKRPRRRHQLSWSGRAVVTGQSCEVILGGRRAFRGREFQHVPIQLLILLLDRLDTWRWSQGHRHSFRMRRQENCLLVLRWNTLSSATAKDATKNQAVAEHSQTHSQQDLQVD